MTYRACYSTAHDKKLRLEKKRNPIAHFSLLQRHTGCDCKKSLVFPSF